MNHRTRAAVLPGVITFVIASCGAPSTVTTLLPPSDREVNWGETCQQTVETMLEVISQQVADFGDLAPSELNAAQLDDELSERTRAVVESLESNACSPVHYHVSLVARIDEVDSRNVTEFLIKARGIDASLSRVFESYMGSVYQVVGSDGFNTYPPQHEFPLDIKTCENVWDAELDAVRQAVGEADRWSDDPDLEGSLTNPIEYPTTDRGPMSEAAFWSLAAALNCDPTDRALYLVGHTNDFKGTGLWSSAYKYTFFRTMLTAYMRAITNTQQTAPSEPDAPPT